MARSVTWDVFHRVDVAFWRVLRKHSLVQDTYDLSKELENHFSGLVKELGL